MNNNIRTHEFLLLNWIIIIIIYQTLVVRE